MEHSKRNYIIIGIIATILIIVIISAIFLIFQNRKVTYQTLIASDGSFQVDFPKHISYQSNQKENNEFVIDLYSTKEELFFYATKIAKSREIDFYQIVNDDKENYLKEKQNIREDSGVVSTTIQNDKAYEYHFIYTDDSYGKDFYCHVVWIETDINLYVLNFEVVDKNKDKFQDVFAKIKNSFIEL